MRNLSYFLLFKCTLILYLDKKFRLINWWSQSSILYTKSLIENLLAIIVSVVLSLGLKLVECSQKYFNHGMLMTRREIYFFSDGTQNSPHKLLSKRYPLSFGSLVTERKALLLLRQSFVTATYIMVGRRKILRSLTKALFYLYDKLLLKKP